MFDVSEVRDHGCVVCTNIKFKYKKHAWIKIVDYVTFARQKPLVLYQIKELLSYPSERHLQRHMFSFFTKSFK